MRTLIMAAALLCAMETIAQKKETKHNSEVAVSKADTTKTPVVKPYNKVITSKVISRKEMFTR